ncbi:MAG: hypothetical protein ACTSUE_20395 [Promethearchaeota archaeon]
MVKVKEDSSRIALPTSVKLTGDLISLIRNIGGISVSTQSMQGLMYCGKGFALDYNKIQDHQDFSELNTKLPQLVPMIQRACQVHGKSKIYGIHVVCVRDPHNRPTNAGKCFVRLIFQI